MKKSILLFSILIGFSCVTFAQTTPYEAGDKNVAIELNPVFNYVGNIFNENSTNDLGITSAGIIYRKFRSPQSAVRLRGTLRVEQGINNSTFPPVQTQKFNSVSAFVGLGTEYRKNINRWSLYSGWEILLSYHHSQSTLNIEEATFGNYRSEFKPGAEISAGPGVFGGAEYFFGDVFFVGAELNAALLAGYNMKSSSTFRDIDAFGNYTETTLEADGGFILDLNTANFVMLRAGVRF